MQRFEKVQKNAQELSQETLADAPIMSTTETNMASLMLPQTTSFYGTTSATTCTSPPTDSSTVYSATYLEGSTEKSLHSTTPYGSLTTDKAIPTYSSDIMTLQSLSMNATRSSGSALVTLPETPLLHSSFPSIEESLPKATEFHTSMKTQGF